MADEIFPRIATDQDKRPACVISEFDVTLARRIRDFCTSLKKIPRAARDVWAPAIAIMRRKLEKMGIGESRILSVWDWYSSNYRPNCGLPFVGNGQEFADRWNWIVDRMDKERLSNPVDESSLCAVSREIMADLDTLIWPKESRAQLAAVVQQSVRNYESHLSRLQEPLRGSEWVYSVILDVMGEVTYYLTQWFRRVHKRIVHWSDWSGNLGSYVWSPTHKDFVASVNAEIAKRTGMEPGGWQDLFETEKPTNGSRGQSS